jgi:hypothetical protein
MSAAVPPTRHSDATATSGSTSAPVTGRMPLDLVEETGRRVTGDVSGVGVGFGRVCVGGVVGVGVIVGADELMHVQVGVGVGVGVGLFFMHLQVGVGVGVGLFMQVPQIGAGVVAVLAHVQAGAVVGVLVGVLVAVGVGAGVLVQVVHVGVGVGVDVCVGTPPWLPPQGGEPVTETRGLPAVAARAIPPPHSASTAVASARTTEAAVHLIGSPVFMESFEHVQ